MSQWFRPLLEGVGSATVVLWAVNVGFDHAFKLRPQFKMVDASATYVVTRENWTLDSRDKQIKSGKYRVYTVNDQWEAYDRQGGGVAVLRPRE